MLARCFLLAPFNSSFKNTRSLIGLDDAFILRRKELASIIEQQSLLLGGTISAEHGIGRLKAASLAECTSPAELALMHCLKSVLDPSQQMNPGVMLTAQSASLGSAIQNSLAKTTAS